MRFLGISLLSVIAVLGTVSFTRCETKQNSKSQSVSEDIPLNVVIPLTQANFTATIAETPVALVKFATPWCGYCKTLAPIYAKAASVLIEKHGYHLYEVNCQEESALCRDNAIDGYPTMKVYYHGQYLEDFYERTVDGIVSYIETMYGPSLLSPTTPEELETIIKKRTTAVFVNVCSDEKSAAAETLRAFSDAHRSYGRYLQVPLSNKLLTSALPNITSVETGIYCYRSFEDVPVFSADAPLTESALEYFVKYERYPVILEVGKEALDLSTSSGAPIILFFYDADELLMQFRKDFDTFARSLRGKYVFTYSPGFQVAQNVGFIQERYPLIAVYDVLANKPYLMNPETPISVESLQYFLDHTEEVDAAVRQAQAKEEPQVKTTPQEEMDTSKGKPPKGTQGEEFIGEEFSVWVTLASVYLSFCPLLL